MAVMATALANLSRMKEQLRDSAEGMILRGSSQDEVYKNWSITMVNKSPNK